ncbi:MAG: hypothetical protein SOX68_03535 [Faecalicoccus sp.]|uniref:Transmembrane protein n=1 Tax=[Pasteurella] mairii TaxID=757 RepID=A0A379B9B7_9PAST|nr:hypothetical protein [Faecalicoccus sp.]MDY4278009.1 hypothetical protein [Faecalicoccus sp.]MDY4279476.1 hypothetical protein [[Pasteurella] mairii]SUB34670.1 Uncharacterised protein [[Pasteurella] mairii]
MNKIILLLVIFLQSCYLANGSPSENEYWFRDSEKLSYKDSKKCSSQVFPNLGERYIYLYNKRQRVGFIEFYKNKKEAEEYNIYLDKAAKLLSKCYYGLGYRFKAPPYWCLAQDGDNTRICIENMRYRN